MSLKFLKSNSTAACTNIFCFLKITLIILILICNIYVIFDDQTTRIGIKLFSWIWMKNMFFVYIISKFTRFNILHSLKTIHISTQNFKLLYILVNIKMYLLSKRQILVL